jgi:hypothetical protein
MSKMAASKANPAKMVRLREFKMPVMQGVLFFLLCPRKYRSGLEAKGLGVGSVYNRKHHFFAKNSIYCPVFYRYITKLWENILHCNAIVFSFENRF